MIRDIKEASTEELKERYEDLHFTIYVAECFGSRDVLEFYMIEQELLNRGCTIQESVEVTIPEPEGEA